LNSINLIVNEIYKEEQTSYHKDIRIFNLINRDVSTFTEQTIDSIYLYLADVKNYYVAMFGKSIIMKDEVIREIVDRDSTSNSYISWMNKYYNENLKKFVRNSDDKYRILEYKNELHQKIDPIYFDPESKIIKAHFFAPVKNIFGIKVSTLWVNVMVIWLFSLLSYGVLYCRVVYRIIDFFNSKAKVKK
ncbi:MAG: hypothetical protein JXA53_04415, partial [Bacteroidales bacterium]|nr:hypothetical protein [Bacteroidales bacterium]